MSDDKETVRKIKYCVHCGTEVNDSEIYHQFHANVLDVDLLLHLQS
ncbi:MAG: hypothetical protein ACTSPN_05400 [Promethearchaeota archaeon]